MFVSNAIKMITLIYALVFFSIFTAFADEPKWLLAPVVDQAPDLALGLNNPVWGKSLKVTITKLESTSADTTTYPCESYWLSADGALYVGFKCINPESPQLWGTPNLPKNSAVYCNESIEFFLGMGNGKWLQMIADAYGNVQNQNSDWQSSVERKEGYWTVIFVIPKAMLSSIWKPGQFLLVNVGRNAFSADGMTGERTALFPPAFCSPQNKLFLGTCDAAALSDKLEGKLAECKKSIPSADLEKIAGNIVSEIEALAKECKSSGAISLEQYKALYDRQVQAEQMLQTIKQNNILRIIFR